MRYNFHYTIPDLFGQLGIVSDDISISNFIEGHRDLLDGKSLHEASFWTNAQADFLREAIADDSDWATIVEELNLYLSNSAQWERSCDLRQ